MYCMSKKSWSSLYSKFLFKIGQGFLDTLVWCRLWLHSTSHFHRRKDICILSESQVSAYYWPRAFDQMQRQIRCYTILMCVWTDVNKCLCWYQINLHFTQHTRLMRNHKNFDVYSSIHIEPELLVIKIYI